MAPSCFVNPLPGWPCVKLLSVRCLRCPLISSLQAATFLSFSSGQGHAWHLISYITSLSHSVLLLCCVLFVPPSRPSCLLSCPPHLTSRHPPCLPCIALLLCPFPRGLVAEPFTFVRSIKGAAQRTTGGCVGVCVPRCLTRFALPVTGQHLRGSSGCLTGSSWRKAA